MPLVRRIRSLPGNNKFGDGASDFVSERVDCLRYGSRPFRRVNTLSHVTTGSLRPCLSLPVPYRHPEMSS